MSSLLRMTAIMLLALCVALPALALAERGEGLVAVGDALACDSSSPVAAVVDMAPLACLEPSAQSVWREPSQEGSGGDRDAQASRPVTAALDGENDDVESVDPVSMADRVAATSTGVAKARIADSTSLGFAEGLFGARVSRGPPAH